MREVTREFLKYGNGEMYSKIKETLIKEIYMDNGKLKEWQDACTFGLSDIDCLIAGQNIYVEDVSKLTYKIV